MLFMLGALFHLGLLVYAMYVLLGVMLLGRFLTNRWVQGIHIERRCDREETDMGGTVAVEVTLRNRNWFTVPWILAEDVLPRDALTDIPTRLRCRGSRTLLVRLGARQEERLVYEIECLRRGYYQIGPLLLESGDVFGLHRRYRVVGEPQFVTVPPQPIALEGYDLATRRPVGEVRLAHRLFQDPTRIAGIRPYEAGDPLNRIHWRATARTGRLQCKTYEPSVLAGATVILDFHEASFAGSGAVACRELAATAAASIAQAMDQLGQPIGLVSNGRDAAERIKSEGWDQEFATRRSAQAQATQLTRSERLQPIMIEPARGSSQVERILHTLGRLETTRGLDFASLVWETTSRLSRHTTLVAVLARVTEADAVLLANLHQRGWPVTVVLIVFEDSSPPDWATAPDWAAWLTAARVDVRRIVDEDSLARFCAYQARR